MSTFVGREHELGRLLAGLDDALDGRGRLFLVGGEPGIGIEQRDPGRPDALPPGGN